MPLTSIKIVKYLLVFSLLFCFCRSGAQVKYDTLSFRIDSLANIGLPKSALKEVDKLDELARKNNNAPQQIRAALYRMTFQSYLEEDALAAIISRLRTDVDKAGYPVKPVLQSLLGQMYWNYYQQNRYQFGQRTRLEKPDTDFTKWDLQTLITQTGHLYDLSLTDSAKEQHTPISVLDGVLEGDSITRYLRPTLYDLLVQRAFDFFLTDEAGLTKPKLPFSLNDPRFFSDSRTFADLAVKTTDTASTAYKGIKYLQQASKFHLEHHDDEALADLDLQRLKFLYARSNVEHKDSLYLSALKQIAEHFSAKPISSEALILEGQYYQGLDSLTMAYDFFKKANAAYPNSLGGKNAATLMRQIEEKELSATVEEVNVPGKPILGLISYRNVKEASVTIYKLTAEQVKKFTDKDAWYEGYNLTPTKKLLEFLKGLQSAQDGKLLLPNPGDYRMHSAEFKINPLAVGTYVILVKDAHSNKGNLIQSTSFTVSNLSYSARVNPNKETELRILNRETGAPLQGVTVTVFKGNEKNGKMIKTNVSSGLSDSNGKYLFHTTQEQYTVMLSKGNDRYTDNEKYFNGFTETNGAILPQVSTILFTDRQLYRPGQVIYFKGLQVSTLNGKSSILPNTPLTIKFNDINYKLISSLQLNTNEFGSVQGSFIIPQNIGNGQLTITTENGTCMVLVEEYKRPTFQVTFTPVTETYRLDDSVTVKGKVTAFSGYGLSNATVAVYVTGQGIPRFEPDFIPRKVGPLLTQMQMTEVKTDTVHTNDSGEFTINFKSNADMQSLNGGVFTYYVNAGITDASGETQSASTTVAVSQTPLQMDADIPQRIIFNDNAVFPLKLTNRNARQLKGIVSVKIFALHGSGQVFKNRLWDSPDQYILKKEEFKSSFTDYSWKNEADYKKWNQAEKISETSVSTNDSTASEINLNLLKNQPSGVYKVTLSAKDEKGDTTSLTQFVSVVAEKGKALKMDDWVIPLVTKVKPNGSAEFSLGINKAANVLVEEYVGPKLLSSSWLVLRDGDQQKIKIGVPVTAKNDFSVQFLMVADNRAYYYYQNIKVVDTVKNLNIRFLTFRNKLQPGEKEQWKLQIKASDNSTLPAEMLADLYDASLDDIAPAQYWRTDFNYEPINPEYYAWSNDDFVKEDATSAYRPRYYNYDLDERKYEVLKMFGYGYYGGYNSGYQNYLQQVQDLKAAAKSDKMIADKYQKNAALVKNGYDVSGRVIFSRDSSAIPGVKVSIKNTNIYTISNSLGYFRIKVPKNGILLFAGKHYLKKSFITKNGGSVTIALDFKPLRIYGMADPGQKSLKGDAKEDATEYETVGNAAAVKFPPPVVKADMEVRESNKIYGYSSGNFTSDKLSKATFKSEPDNSLFVRKIATANPIIPRTNFNETAFFYPQLHTDEKGQILIDFTIPEALTRWKFRGFAHTQDLKTGYIENTVVTQKQLSISANTPRFLREGDTITISARLANLTAGTLKGKVQMQLFNALNMQPVSLFVNKADAEQAFEVAGNTNQAVSFKLVIPAGLDALDYKLTADAGEFTDGEENTLPVLPNRTLVTESMPMMVRPGQTRNFTFDKLVSQSSSTLKNKTLTLEYTQNPAWYAVQALPYMMEFPYECSEQVFSRYFANSLATNLVNKMPVIKQVFDQWKMSNSGELLSNLEKNPELKSTLLEETPWLRDAVSESEQKKRIALLFDLNKMSDELKLNLDKLQKRQLPDGSFTWFGGDLGDRYITQHIAEGVGELYHLGIGVDDVELKQISDNALKYLDDQLTADEKLRKKNKDGIWFYGDLEIHAWFTRSYFLNKPLDKGLNAALANYLKWAAEEWKSRNVYEQGMIALTMQRYKKADVTAQIERSLLETAQQSDDLGMCWAKNQRGYFWYESPVETQSLLIELFTEAGDNTKAVDEMKVWLLRNKQTNYWKTTKATAAACYALLLKGSNLLADTGQSLIKLGGKTLEELKPDTKTDAGTGYIKSSWVDDQIKPALGKVEIKNNSTNISWGALHWQYLENLDKITSSETNIKLERKYFIQKQTDAGLVLTAVDATHQPKTGDLLKVVVYLKADRDFEYVQLKDMRPAGTEPVDALSTYKYQDGLYYYQVTKDVATNFFISYLNKGNYVFEYQLRVAQPGNFSTGITGVQCMYAPEFNAHSQGGRMVIKL
ncbi:alpha-2-macroglobulin family protein [Mucilaginibacter sp.]|uniref:alpha-2-macroglobulin family protein n=1 Tax=Mucilaginibacter sp. TaxID=1882438 RepID=UPI00284120BE|nr:alpha-2-macroglobulin family protein [Mucilaginibacter sp.]MDR3694177.1 alpha-2-macroglobulin family protein [Mucilaginibacter sp.]